MCKSVYSRRWDKVNGFTMKEATERKKVFDKEYEVENPDSKWKPAEIEVDPERRSGYRIVMCTKS